MNKSIQFSVLIILMTFFFQAPYSFSDFKRDYIKETQTESVQVTEEFLKREAEPGPASPTFKVADSAKFLTEQPYKQNDVTEEVLKPEEKTKWWDKWFNWGSNKKE